MLTTLLFSILCAFAPTAVFSTETVAAPDTARFYLIDNETIHASEFNGSQLVGQTIVAYTVDTVKAVSVNKDSSIQPGGDRVVIIHYIQTEKGPKLPDNLGAHVFIRGNEDPLYIVDDVVVAADEVKIMDMQTIESISVLKAKTAVAHYGPAAQHGVVIIHTKKASK